MASSYLPAVDRQRRRIQPLVDRLGSCFARRRLAAADDQVQAHALVELAFVGVLLEDAFQEIDRASVVVSLQGLEASFVQRNGLALNASEVVAFGGG